MPDKIVKESTPLHIPREVTSQSIPWFLIRLFTELARTYTIFGR